MRNYSLFLITYTLLVILWGAWVRISGSGDGCGEHWPLCHNKVLPLEHALPTWIEFSHRLMSGVYGLLVLGLVIIARRSTIKGHPLRFWSLVVAAFTLTEAALGAKLVLFGLVGDDASVARAYTMALHMVNSLLLMGSIALCYFYAKTPKATSRVRVEVAQLPPFRFRQGVAVLPFLIIACTGAIASLSGTLFPSESLLGALKQDFAAGSHFLLRLRISHPLMATLVGGGLFMFAYYHWDSTSVAVQRAAKKFAVVLLVALVFGYATLFLLSPTWMKLTHLALAHTLWVLFVLFLAELAWTKRFPLASPHNT